MNSRWKHEPRGSELSDSKLEALLKRDFAGECRQGFSDHDLDQLAVDRAMFLARRPEGAMLPWRTPAPRRLPAPRRSLMALAIAALFIGGAAAAVFGARGVSSTQPPLVVAPPTTAAQKPQRNLEVRVPLARSSEPLERTQRSAPPAPAARASRPKKDVTKPAPSAQARPSPAMLFERANRLKHQGQTLAALREYKRLQLAYPSTREAQLSYAICGRLQLQLSRPAQALQQFNQYLAGGGAATQDALAGQADAYRQLGDARGETAAWLRLLRNYPKSVHARRARSRLKALE